jgi:hypothetical protein
VPVVPFTIRPPVTGGQGQGQAEAEKGVPGEPPGGVLHAQQVWDQHPQVCLVAKSTCMLWHMWIPRKNPTRNISNNNARPAKPDDKYLARLKAECRAEELKARIRATKMMSQGICYSQMVESPPHRVPAHVAPRAVRTALTPDGAINILKDAVERLRLLLP